MKYSALVAIYAVAADPIDRFCVRFGRSLFVFCSIFFRDGLPMAIFQAEADVWVLGDRRNKKALTYVSVSM